MDDIENLSKWIRLNSVKGIGPSRAMKLMQIFGNVEKVFTSTFKELEETRVFDEKSLAEFDKVAKSSDEGLRVALENAKRSGMKMVALNEEDYPHKLRFIPDPPTTLFYYGNYKLIQRKIIAVVGTRQAEKNALDFSRKFSRELAEKDFVICSGGALGIDAAAHKGALEAGTGTTICVFGTGLERPYPPENLGLFEEIKKKNGLILGENLPNFPGAGIAFVRRNRITSGLSDAVVLVASGEKGGAMVQSKITFQQKRPLYCPALKLGLKPNEGLKNAIENLGAKEFSDAGDFLRQFENSGKEKQMRLG